MHHKAVTNHGPNPVTHKARDEVKKLVKLRANCIDAIFSVVGEVDPDGKEHPRAILKEASTLCGKKTDTGDQAQA